MYPKFCFRNCGKYSENVIHLRSAKIRPETILSNPSMRRRYQSGDRDEEEREKQRQRRELVSIAASSETMLTELTQRPIIRILSAEETNPLFDSFF